MPLKIHTVNPFLGRTCENPNGHEDHVKRFCYGVYPSHSSPLWNPPARAWNRFGHFRAFGVLFSAAQCPELSEAGHLCCPRLCTYTFNWLLLLFWFCKQHFGIGNASNETNSLKVLIYLVIQKKRSMHHQVWPSWHFVISFWQLFPKVLRSKRKGRFSVHTQGLIFRNSGSGLDGEPQLSVGVSVQICSAALNSVSQLDRRGKMTHSSMHFTNGFFTNVGFLTNWIYGVLPR